MPTPMQQFLRADALMRADPELKSILDTQRKEIAQIMRLFERNPKAVFAPVAHRERNKFLKNTKWAHEQVRILFKEEDSRQLIVSSDMDTNARSLQPYFDKYNEMGVSTYRQNSLTLIIRYKNHKRSILVQHSAEYKIFGDSKIGITLVDECL